MIRMPAQDRDRAIDLLEQHHAHELVRPGERAEGQMQRRACPRASARARPARRSRNRHRARRRSSRAGASEADCSRAPRRAGRAIAVAAPLGNDVRERDQFFQHAALRVARAAFGDLDDVEGAEADAAAGFRRALAVALRELYFRARASAAPQPRR